MATDKSQTYCLYSWIAKMSYYYFGEFYINAHTGFQTMMKVSFFIGRPSYVQFNGQTHSGLSDKVVFQSTVFWLKMQKYDFF